MLWRVLQFPCARHREQKLKFGVIEDSILGESLSWIFPQDNSIDLSQVAFPVNCGVLNLKFGLPFFGQLQNGCIPLCRRRMGRKKFWDLLTGGSLLPL